MPTIGLFGDVMLGRMVGKRLAEVAPEDLWATEIREICRGCDLVVCNLECCIATRGKPTGRVRGKPFFFRGPPAAVGSLEAIRAGAVGLANNHALDYGEAALLETLDLLGGAGIAVAGAGRDDDGARRGATARATATRVGLVAASDHPREFAASSDAPGIAYADLRHGVPEWLGAELARMRQECDLVIAFLHWGANMTSEPERWQRRAAGELQEAGADLVAGHSAHVFHGVGWNERGPLLYDLGDALDDYAVDPRLRNDLGVLTLWRPEDAGGELELIGLALDFCHTRLAEGEEAEWIAARLHSACEGLGTGVERTAEGRFRVTPL
jgi:poly-gamma-glutamate synthesis protein (capsule biosynthesis protein)